MVAVKNTLPNTSRVWVYQSNRTLNSSELEIVEEKLSSFNACWEAHGTKLDSSVEVFYDRFIVFFVNEAPQQATGCSIDKSVALVKELESELGITLLDRLNIAYKAGENVESMPMADFQAAIKEGQFNADSIVFNNMIQSKEEFINKWEVAAKDSWHANLML